MPISDWSSYVGSSDLRRLAPEEQALGLAPALGGGDLLASEPGPGLRRVVAVDRAHPEQQAEARRRGARVLQDDLQVVGRLDQLLQALRRALQRLGFVDEGEVAAVERQEDVIAQGDGARQYIRSYAVQCEGAPSAFLC